MDKKSSNGRAKKEQTVKRKAKKKKTFKRENRNKMKYISKYCQQHGEIK